MPKRFILLTALFALLIFLHSCDTQTDDPSNLCGGRADCFSTQVGGDAIISNAVESSVTASVISEGDTLATLRWSPNNTGVMMEVMFPGETYVDTLLFDFSMPSLEQASELAAVVVYLNDTESISGAREGSSHRASKSFIQSAGNNAGCDFIGPIADFFGGREGGIGHCGRNGQCCDRHDVCIEQSCTGQNDSGNVIACTIRNFRYNSCLYNAEYEGIGTPDRCLDTFPPCSSTCTECHASVTSCFWNEDPGPSNCCAQGDCGECQQCIIDDVVETDPCECARNNRDSVDPCEEEPDNVPPCNSCGDVHIRTPDGLNYDFQAAGEFLMAASQDGEVVVQGRLEPLGNRDISINTAVAMNVAGDRVGVYRDRSPALYVNGVPTEIEQSLLGLPNGGTIYLQRRTTSTSRYIVEWPNGFTASAILRGRALDIGVRKAKNSAEMYDGLLGNSNGNPNDDMRTREGQFLATPVQFNDLYKVFGHSWRITQAESLFDYEPGKSTETYTLLDFPSRPLSLNDFDTQTIEDARNRCIAAGVTDPLLLEDCMLDIAATGDDTFAESAAEASVPTVELDVQLPVFFDDWFVENAETGPGSWRMQDDGRTALQQNNTNGPTFLLSPGEYLNATITGKFTVETAEDDDFVGFVIGYKSPLSINNDNPNDFQFIVFNWKQADQQLDTYFAPAGFSLARVNGVIEPERFSGVTSYPQFWTHTGANIELINSNYAPNLGWEDNREYSFELTYTASQLIVSIDGDVIFNEAGSFSRGHFGFYNFSQEQVRYYDFNAMPIASRSQF